MSNFTPIVFLDIFELAGSLRQQIGLFDHSEPRIMPVIQPRKGTEDEDEDFVMTAAAAKWVACKNFLGRLKRKGETIFGPIDLGRVYLEMLDPGVKLPWSEPLTGGYIERYTRLHLALRTNPQAFMLAGTEWASPAMGWLTGVNVRVPSMAANFGEWPRVHLVIDVRKKDQPE